LREFDALDALGLDFVILSLKPCRDRVIQSAAKRFLERTYYPFRRAGKSTAFGEAWRAAATTRGALPWAGRPLQCAYVAWAAGRLAGIARSLSVRHIHAHWATAPASAAVVMSRILGVPYSFTAHAWDIYAGDGRIAAKARGARFVTTCTQANVDYIRTLLPRDDWDKVMLNYHGVPESAGFTRNGRQGGPLRISAVGRLVETKGFEYLLRALSECQFPFEAVIMGDGLLRGRLSRAVRSRGLSGKVRFTGTVPNEEVLRTLAESDVFVMPSVVGRNGDRDGIPNVLLEAMSVGLPVVASGISGIPEAVIDGQTGILVGEKDAQAIAAALEQLNRDREMRARLGAAGRALVQKRFSAESNARSLFEIFARHVARARE
jgi:glycosyltransferase involved in cell wall biosynthesis